MIEPILSPARSAQSAREFHAAMDSWFAMAAPMLASAAQFANIGGNQRSGAGYNSYGGEYDDMMDEEMMMEQEMMEMEQEMSGSPF